MKLKEVVTQSIHHVTRINHVTERLGLALARGGFEVQYVSVIAWVFDFRKFITITDVSLQAMYIACAPIASLCSQDGLIHERRTKYLVPWM